MTRNLLIVIGLLATLLTAAGCSSPPPAPATTEMPKSHQEQDRRIADERIKELVAQLNDQDDYKRINAAIILSRLNAKEAIPYLLSNHDAMVRRITIATLMGLPDKEGIPEIIKLLSDPDAEVRQKAILALKIMEAKEAIPELIKSLSDSNVFVRGHAALALGDLNAKEAIPKIKELLTDQEENVFLLAEYALKQLGVPDKEIEEAKIIAEIAELYPKYHNRKNLIIKYYLTMETNSDYDPDFKEYNQELSEKIIAVIKKNPIAFDGNLPAAYKKVFYENNKILWEEIYSWKGMILRFNVDENNEQTKKVEHWFDISEMRMFVKGTLFGNK